MRSIRLWQLLRLSRRLWVRTTLIALLSILAALGAPLIGPLIPTSLSDRIGEDAVMPILNVLATSMLTVTTFSLSIMVTTHRMASTQVTPRSHRLLLEDTTTQTVLATFLGAFLFALVSIFLFRAGLKAAQAPVVVFGFSVLVVGLVVIAILRWIEHLSRLGSMDDTIGQVTDRARDSLERQRRAPSFGAHPLSGPDAIPDGAVPVPARRGGNVQFVDLPALSDCAEENDVQIYVTSIPGDFAVAGAPLAHVVPGGRVDETTVQNAFGMEAVRSFDQDARFGLMVLSEIALRALSPGLNDPGTAIEVIGRLERLLAECDAPDGEVAHERVWMRPVTAEDLIEDAFNGIARDGAAMIEVPRRLIRALDTLRQGEDAELARAARGMARRALAYADRALVLDEDKAALHALADL